MKKIFIGLAAVAAVGVSALCFSNSNYPETLSENVSALSFAYCVKNDEEECLIQWLDGDEWWSDRFEKIGRDEVEEWYHKIYLEHKSEIVDD